MFCRPTAGISRDTRQFIGNWTQIFTPLEDYQLRLQINTTQNDLKKVTE